MRTYATKADLIEWTGGKQLDNAISLLRAASSLVRRETLFAVYQTDADRNPVESSVKTALRDAVCAQAAYWSKLNYDPDLGVFGTEQQIASESFNGANISYKDNKAADERRETLGDDLAPLAFNILDEAGLLYGTLRG